MASFLTSGLLVLLVYPTSSQDCICSGPGTCANLNEITCLTFPSCQLICSTTSISQTSAPGCTSDNDCLATCDIGGCLCDQSSGTGICECSDGVTPCEGLDCSNCGNCNTNSECFCRDTTNCRCQDDFCTCNMDNSLCPGLDCSSCSQTPGDFDCINSNECVPCPAGGCTCSNQNTCLCGDSTDCGAQEDCTTCGDGTAPPTQAPTQPPTQPSTQPPTESGDCNFNSDCNCADSTNCRCQSGECTCNSNNAACGGLDCAGCQQTSSSFDCVNSNECSPCNGDGCTCSSNSCKCRDGSDCGNQDDCSDCSEVSTDYILEIVGVRVDTPRFDFDDDLCASWQYTVDRIGLYNVSFSFDSGGSLTSVAFGCSVTWSWEIGNLVGGPNDIGLLSFLRLLANGPGNLQSATATTSGPLPGAAPGSGANSAFDAFKSAKQAVSLPNSGSAAADHVGITGDRAARSDSAADVAADVAAGIDGDGIQAQSNSPQSPPPPPSPPVPEISPPTPPIILPEYFDLLVWSEIEFWVDGPASLDWFGVARVLTDTRCELVERVSTTANNPDVKFDSVCSVSTIITEVCDSQSGDVIQPGTDGDQKTDTGDIPNIIGAASGSDDSDDRFGGRECVDEQFVSNSLDFVSGATGNSGGQTTWPANGFGTIDCDPPSISPVPPSPYVPVSPNMSPAERQSEEGQENTASPEASGSPIPPTPMAFVDEETDGIVNDAKVTFEI